MFNRVGNLTVLSLRREINQIIEEYCTSQKYVPDDLNDFATVRIYWRCFQPSGEQNSRRFEKAFYLYQQDSLIELAKNDLEALLPHTSIRVREKVNLGLHYQDALTVANLKANPIDG
jgi:hypothetical protein